MLSGLKLANDTVCLKICRKPTSVQLLLRNAGEMNEASPISLRIPFGLKLPIHMKRIEDLWGVAGGVVSKRKLRQQDSKIQEQLLVLDGHLDGKSHREIAIDLFGLEAVADEWSGESWIRSLVRRRIRKSVTLMKGGYRGLLDDRQ